MNKQEIISVLEDLYRTSGFRVSLHGVDLTEIAAFPEENLSFCSLVQSTPEGKSICANCDKEACTKALDQRCTQVYRCPYGLIEAVSPLYTFGTLTGFLMMGQVAPDQESKNRALDILKYQHGEDNTDELAEKIPLVNGEAINSYVNIMTICASYLTMSNAIPSRKPSVAEQAKRFIDGNFHRKIVISDICRELNCSKSTLLTSFKSQYGTTVNNYLTDVRLNRALGMIRDGNMTISEISSETGFSDQSYFSKVFSSRYGIPPSEFRHGKEESEQGKDLL